jgi:hypothetical protein
MWVPGGIALLRCNWFTSASRREIARLVHCNQISRDDVPVSAAETLKALQALAQQSGHPEVAWLPIVASGYSHVTNFTQALVENVPERLAGIFTGGVGGMGPMTAAEKKVPWMHFDGELDGKRDKGATHLATGIADRAGGALFAKAIRWEAPHEWGDVNNLFFPWAYRIILARTRELTAVPTAPVAPVPATEAGGWLVDMPGWGAPFPQVAPFAAYAGDRTQAGWVADGFTAHVWRAYTTARSSTPVRITSPAPQCASCLPTVRRSGEAFTVEVAVSRPAATVELWDGDRTLAALPGPPYRLGGLALPPGVHALIAVATFADGQKFASKPSAVVSTRVTPPTAPAADPP